MGRYSLSKKNSADRGIAKRQSRNEKLERKAAKYDVKANKRALKNIKRGYDAVGLVATKKSAKLNVKAAKLERKALNQDPDSRKYLATKRLSTKKDYKYQIKAAKARYKIENNNIKIDSLNSRSVDLGRRLLEADDND